MTAPVAINARAAGRRVIELDLMTADQHNDLPDNEEITAADRLIVESPTNTGLIVIKALAAEPGDADKPSERPPQTQQVTPPDEGGVHTGIIHPPATIDPGMTRPAPNPQAFPTPVVPPPGTPGGNPQVIPK